MRIAKTVGAVALSVSLAGCMTLSQVSDYCRTNPIACTVVGLFVAGGVILTAGVLLQIGPFAAHHAVYSDSRLKEDVRLLKVLDGGVKVYTFRYKGDNRYFVGVLAQDLLNDERYRGAVGKDENGYYLVDYSALGLKLHGEKAMRDAGKAAIARAG